MLFLTKKVKNYINENYMYEVKLKALADLANMSESAFSRFFKLHTGRTMSDYIIDIRMGFATRHDAGALGDGFAVLVGPHDAVAIGVFLNDPHGRSPIQSWCRAPENRVGGRSPA